MADRVTEAIVYQVLTMIWSIAFIIALLFLWVQTFRYIRHLGKKNTDNYTIVTFICLCLSTLI